MRVACEADLYETWELDIPAGVMLRNADEIHAYVSEKLSAGECDFIEQSSDNEHDREILHIDSMSNGRRLYEGE